MATDPVHRNVILDAIEQQFGTQKFDQLIDVLEETIKRKRFRFWQIDLFDALKKETGHCIETVADYRDLFGDAEFRTKHRTPRFPKTRFPRYHCEEGNATTDEIRRKLNELDDAVSYDTKREIWGIEFGDPIILASAAGLILGEGTYDRLISGFDLLYEGSRDGPWATRIPPALIDAFVDLTDARIPATADEWLRIDEFCGQVSSDTCVKNLRWLRSILREFKGINVVPCLWMTL